jgi:uncharacterized protein (DUF849 family)
MHKVMIEVRINELAGRKDNKHVPWTAAEIAAAARDCASAGASIVHFHPRTADGAMTRDDNVYRDIVAALRQACDLLIHPTLLPYPSDSDADFRLEPITRLAADGLRPELTPVVLATTNLDSLDEAGRFRNEEMTFINTTGTTRRTVERLRELSVVPYADVWNVPTLRQLVTFARTGVWTRPVYMMFALMSEAHLFGHPGTAAGLRAYTDFLPDDVPLHWSPYFVGGNLLSLIPQIVAGRGHISIGLGDYPYRELGEPSNAEIVAEAVRQIRKCGADIATPAEARAAIGIPAHGMRGAA